MIAFGQYPVAGLVLCGLLFSVYWFGLRLRCRARSAQMFIVVAMLITLAVTVVRPVKVLDRPAIISLAPDSDGSKSDDFSYTSVGGEQTIAETVLPDSKLRTSNSPPILAKLDVARLLYGIYVVGVVALLLYLVVQLVYLRSLLRRYEWKERVEGDICVYDIHDDGLPFSFGNYIFLPASLPEPMRGNVLIHELNHVRHNHFSMLCFLQVLLALCWFNPFVWLFFQEMRLQQELEVDGDVLAEGVDSYDYQLSLVNIAVKPGKWLMTRSPFLGKSLRLRLLYMNTPMNNCQSRLRLLAVSLAVVAIVGGHFVVSCSTHQQQQRHPLQGCWQLESLPMQYKFFGDYGELVYGINSGELTNTSYFWMSGMEQHQKGDSLFDRHGLPVKYELQGNGDEHIWYWIHYNATFTDSVERMERWRRVQPDTSLIAMFQTMSTLGSKQRRSHLLEGVWQLDSVAADWQGIRYVEDSTKLNPSYLLASDSCYMRFEINRRLFNRFLDFTINGDCGPLNMSDNGYVQLRSNTYELLGSGNYDHVALRIDESQNPFSGGPGMTTYYYRRIAMPLFLPRLLSPALIKE